MKNFKLIIEYDGTDFHGWQVQPDVRTVPSKLPDDVVVKHVQAAPPDFHARFSCIGRRYVYRITSARTAVYRRMLTYSKYALDVDRMTAGAEYLLGEKDFTSFAPASLEESVSPVCNVLEALFRRDGAIVSFDIKADRFLHHMVRNIVGTLMEVGRGRFDPEQIEDILRKKDRKAAGPTAPACGLTLMEAYYPE
jgi:tRNA pseudouridine38-40 synthase